MEEEMKQWLDDALHWLFITFLGALSFVIENSNHIVALCAVVAALLQVYIQIRRARKEP